MDPNEALRKLREAVSQYHQTSSTESDDVFLAIAYEAMEAAEALDEWLSKGGFLPDAWRVASSVGQVRPTTPPPNPNRRRVHLRLPIPPARSAHMTDPLGPPDPAGVELPDRTVEE